MKRFLTIRATAREFELPEAYLRRLVNAGGVPGFKSGRRVYIDTTLFREMLDGLVRANGNGQAQAAQ